MSDSTHTSLISTKLSAASKMASGSDILWITTPSTSESGLAIASDVTSVQGPNITPLSTWEWDVCNKYYSATLSLTHHTLSSTTSSPSTALSSLFHDSLGGVAITFSLHSHVGSPEWDLALSYARAAKEADSVGVVLLVGVSHPPSTSASSTSASSTTDTPAQETAESIMADAASEWAVANLLEFIHVPLTPPPTPSSSSNGSVNGSVNGSANGSANGEVGLLGGGAKGVLRIAEAFQAHMWPSISLHPKPILPAPPLIRPRPLPSPPTSTSPSTSPPTSPPTSTSPPAASTSPTIPEEDDLRKQELEAAAFEATLSQFASMREEIAQLPDEERKNAAADMVMALAAQLFPEDGSDSPLLPLSSDLSSDPSSDPSAPPLDCQPS